MSIKKIKETYKSIVGLLEEARQLRDLIFFNRAEAAFKAAANPLNAFGCKCFSQNDEDGLTLEILRRIDRLEGGTFVELGVGDGLENNTLILAALGWRGFWAGGQSLAFDATTSPRLNFAHKWITRDDVADIVKEGLQASNIERPDVVSIDLDGNDYHIAEALLADDLKPALFIVEYNAKFPPPVRFVMDYNPDHRWAHDDYFGASLGAFVALFERNDYKLVCCNAQTGSNAFFVDAAHKAQFGDVPSDIRDIYMPPKYFLYNNYGHKPSVRTVEQILGCRAG